MQEQQIQELIAYWKDTAEHDHKTMETLYRAGEYSNALFFGHIILEKILKAHVVAATKNEAPYIHDLLRLREIADISLQESELDVIDQANRFNIRARYPDFKLKFYKMCTKEFTDRHYAAICGLYEKLCRLLK